MLVVVQHPVVDVRGLLPGPDHRIDSPKWPHPLRVHPRGSQDDCRTDFIRGLGPVRRRMRGNPSPWLNESFYVDARNRIVLSRMRGTEPRLPFRVRLKPLFRRFYSDGVVGRFEIGFFCDLDFRGLDLATITSGARTALGVLARIRGGAAEPQPLAHFGQALAGHLLSATTRRTADGFTPPRWWVSVGTPGVFLELQQRSKDEPPPVRLWHTSPIVTNTPVSCWTIADSADSDRELLRRLRVQVSHLHADLAALETVLGFCRSGRLAPGAGVEDFLDDMCGKLLRPERHGLRQREYLTEVIDAAHGYYADRIWMLQVLSNQVSSKGLARKLTDAATMLSEALERPRGNFYLINGGDLVQEKNETVVHGSAGVVASKSTVTMRDVNMGTQGADLAALVEKLEAEVAALRGKVTDEAADQAEDAVASVNKELAAKEPDKPGMLRRLNALVALAKGAGGAGTAVAAAVTALRAALGL
ncbi:Uncharacterised protein [Amycolatopsis camponoti]|uniref:Uncharacterized protein n=1 Tax=Amycolatopsis camponoti TaxID=2606593 RepID=A0A6I8LVB9_9PSEU|nr:hypothetical protein [Amycolatopsis camponoti]VVJ21080.1 Uncharacterised protein [Amycolatopsis camponoti]